MAHPRVLLAITTILAVIATTAGAVAAQESQPTAIPITGHGFGHGRGMSQYGALGYAIDFGWSSDQILNHYYGDTTAGTVGNSLLTVRLESADNQATVAQVDSGAMVLIDDGGNVTHLGTGGAIRLTAVSGGFTLADAPTCAGPFVDRPGVISAEQIRISTANAQQSGGTGTVGAGTVVAGDWDGDGDDEVATAQGANWTLYSGSVNNPAASVRTTFTMPAGTALSGDWNGNGVDTAGVFSDGTWSLGNGSDLTTLNFGRAGDVAVVGDWDGDGDDDIGVRRGSTWILAPGDGAANIRVEYGDAGDEPLVGDWDGDGTDDLGLLRGSTWIRRVGGASLGANIDRITYANANSYLIGDWDGDGIDQPGRHDGGTIDLTGPLVDIEPRLNPNLPIAETIQRCVSTSEQRYYRGELRAVRNNGAQRTVNAVAVESYLRAVVPREMPASWALLGDGSGAEALETQAVSARSYSLAENRTSYARTCDTISCQVYDGRATRRNGSLSSNEHELSDIAIQQSAGVVRMRDGQVARTELSSSTGGWSAGGVFPAVEDLGDSVSLNPNHDWTNSVQISTIEARYSGRTLDRVFVSERNGLGEDGGRVLTITLEFGAETFTMTGNEFRRLAGLRSDWFSIDWKRGPEFASCVCPEDVEDDRRRVAQAFDE